MSDSLGTAMKNVDESMIVKPKPISFSVIVTTRGDFPALERTLTHLILQQGDGAKVGREIIVCGDGFESEVVPIINRMKGLAEAAGQNVEIGYGYLAHPVGTGNIARALGLKKATGDYIMFTDAGTAVVNTCFNWLTSALEQYPDAWLISWDIVQLIDPVPLVSGAQLIFEMDRSNGLPYVIPGIAAAIRRDYAQQVEWPNTRASDWGYFSMLWEKMFGKPEDKSLVEKHVVVAPAALMVAYGTKTEHKYRATITNEEYTHRGYDKGWVDLNKQELTDGPTDSNS